MAMLRRSARHALFLVLGLAVSTASSMHLGMHMSHAGVAGRAGAGPQLVPTRGDYVGATLLTGEACGNGLTCSPAACVKGTNPACAVANNNGPTTNKSNALMASTLATVQSRSCHYPGILAAYCNDAYIVVHSSGLAAHPNSLSSVFTPPGGGTCISGADSCGYADQCVTRDYASTYAVYKIPLAPVALSTASGTVNNALVSFTSPMTVLQTATVLGTGDQNNLLYLNGLTSMPTRGNVALSVSGLNMFPNMNNNGGLTFPSCETDMCNAHAGQGFDYHYHGDPFGPQCLYSCANYATISSHPPLIGYGMDGFPIFGRYLSAAAPGASVALDDCGGHIHSGFGGSAASGYVADNVYHYHAFVSNISSMHVAPYAYKAYLYGPYMCYKGDISSAAIPNFFESNANPVARTDYASGQIKPCTGDSNIYLAPGFSLNGQSGSGTNYSALMTTTYATVGAGSTGGACAAVAATLSPPPPSPPVGVQASSPPPPSPSPAATTAPVTLTATLSGYSKATFSPAAQTAFAAAVAATPGHISPSAVTITSITDAPAPSGRHLLQSSVVVAFTASTSLSAADASAALSTGTTFSTELNTAFSASTLTTPVPTSMAVVLSPAPASAAAAGGGGSGAGMAAVLAALLVAALL